MVIRRLCEKEEDELCNFFLKNGELYQTLVLNHAILLGFEIKELLLHGVNKNLLKNFPFFPTRNSRN